MSKKRTLSLTLMTTLWALAVLFMLVGCAKDDNEKLIRAAKEGRLDEVTRLLKSGADINAKDGKGDTALIGACFWGHTDVVKLLLEKGADVKAKKHGWLHSADDSL